MKEKSKEKAVLSKSHCHNMVEWLTKWRKKKMFTAKLVSFQNNSVGIDWKTSMIIIYMCNKITDRESEKRQNFLFIFFKNVYQSYLFANKILFLFLLLYRLQCNFECKRCWKLFQKIEGFSFAVWTENQILFFYTQNIFQNLRNYILHNIFTIQFLS